MLTLLSSMHYCDERFCTSVTHNQQSTRCMPAGHSGIQAKCKKETACLDLSLSQLTRHDGDLTRLSPNERVCPTRLVPRMDKQIRMSNYWYSTCLTNMPHASQILYLAVNFSLFTENHVESTVPYSSSDSVAGSEETQQSLTVNGATSDKTTSKQSMNGHRGIYSKVEGDHHWLRGFQLTEIS